MGIEIKLPLWLRATVDLDTTTVVSVQLYATYIDPKRQLSSTLLGQLRFIPSVPAMDVPEPLDTMIMQVFVTRQNTGNRKIVRPNVVWIYDAHMTAQELERITLDDRFRFVQFSKTNLYPLLIDELKLLGETDGTKET